MEKEEIEKKVRGYVRDNYLEHPAAFAGSIIEMAILSTELGQSYWEHNSSSETLRDTQAGVTVEDYITWVALELYELKKPELYN